MTNKLYVDRGVMDNLTKEDAFELLAYKTGIDLERIAKDFGYYCSFDDMGDCYFSISEDAELFEEVCEIL